VVIKTNLNTYFMTFLPTKKNVTVNHVGKYCKLLEFPSIKMFLYNLTMSLIHKCKIQIPILNNLDKSTFYKYQLLINYYYCD